MFALLFLFFHNRLGGPLARTASTTAPIPSPAIQQAPKPPYPRA